MAHDTEVKKTLSPEQEKRVQKILFSDKGKEKLEAALAKLEQE